MKTIKNKEVARLGGEHNTAVDITGIITHTTAIGESCTFFSAYDHTVAQPTAA